MVQLLSGLITCLPAVIYCREQYNEPVNIRRVRELRHQIANEATELYSQWPRKQGRPRKIKRSGRKKRRARI